MKTNDDVKNKHSKINALSEKQHVLCKNATVKHEKNKKNFGMNGKAKARIKRSAKSYDTGGSGSQSPSRRLPPSPPASEPPSAASPPVVAPPCPPASRWSPAASPAVEGLRSRRPDLDRGGRLPRLALGRQGVVVASTPDAARLFLRDHGGSFLDRPADDVAPMVLAYGAQDLVFAPYGPRWRRLRRECSLSLLGPQALADWAGERGEEVGRMVRMVRRVLDEAGGEDAREFKEMVVELMTTAGLVNLGDFLWSGTSSWPVELKSCSSSQT
ncbi:Flavonoid 3',5'-hydroxylase 2 [Hordeum vulgare]|nr:Flavonoid 3',5'-hydroxylase 2 [Hordeum vulgare]